MTVYGENEPFSIIDLLLVTELVAQPDDTVNIIDLLLVTDLEIEPAANGSRKKRKG